MSHADTKSLSHYAYLAVTTCHLTALTPCTDSDLSSTKKTYRRVPISSQGPVSVPESVLKK